MSRQTATVTSHAIRERGTGVFSRAPMTAALTPDLALTYLGELSTDIRAAVVLDNAGNRVAGEAVLAEEARALLSGGDPLAESSSPRGRVFAARGQAHSVAVLTGRFALAALVRHDLGRVLEDLAPPAA